MKTYKLTTIKDIFEQIPINKIEECMGELTRSLMTAKTTSAAMKGLAHDITGDAENSSLMWPDSLEWIDDGKGEVVSNVQINGVKVGSINS